MLKSIAVLRIMTLRYFYWFGYNPYLISVFSDEIRFNLGRLLRFPCKNMLLLDLFRKHEGANEVQQSNFSPAMQ